MPASLRRFVLSLSCLFPGLAFFQCGLVYGYIYIFSCAHPILSYIIHTTLSPHPYTLLRQHQSRILTPSSSYRISAMFLTYDSCICFHRLPCYP
ncbi:hypothetical protein B0H15DRAFT_205828 [Mycena belliarum]|uniref:Uncharacterized protein n=1 Tax=Mycena belliarum TaxID=1033014 RepID=A0AAD6XZB0_9AGAR|nr:hypothetical protein B0H15DRAFT_205828 [Mycena belliae]